MKVIILFTFEFPQLQPDTYWRNKIELHVNYIFSAQEKKNKDDLIKGMCQHQHLCVTTISIIVDHMGLNRQLIDGIKNIWPFEYLMLKITNPNRSN